MLHQEIVGTITERTNQICKRRGFAITFPESHVRIVLDAYSEVYEENKTASKNRKSHRPAAQG